jgi:hypothetical protein
VITVLHNKSKPMVNEKVEIIYAEILKQIVEVIKKELAR